MNYSTEQQLNQLINNYNKKNEFESGADDAENFSNELSELDNFDKKLKQRKKMAIDFKSKKTISFEKEHKQNLQSTKAAETDDFYISMSPKNKILTSEANASEKEGAETSPDDTSQAKVTIHGATDRLQLEIKQERIAKSFLKKQSELEEHVQILEEDKNPRRQAEVERILEANNAEGESNPKPAKAKGPGWTG